MEHYKFKPSPFVCFIMVLMALTTTISKIENYCYKLLWVRDSEHESTHFAFCTAILRRKNKCEPLGPWANRECEADYCSIYSPGNGDYFAKGYNLPRQMARYNYSFSF